jgi:hypothetical protein
MKGNGSSSGLCTPLARFDEGGWEQVSAGLAGSIGLEANKIVLENILGSDRTEANKIELENIFRFASIKPRRALPVPVSLFSGTSLIIERSETRLKSGVSTISYQRKACL